MNRHAGGNWTEALQYHTNCLQLLIPVLSGRQEDYTEEILATVAILRLIEEMDGIMLPAHNPAPELMNLQYMTIDST
jgi:hypothetical protein